MGEGTGKGEDNPTADQDHPIAAEFEGFLEGLEDVWADDEEGDAAYDDPGAHGPENVIKRLGIAFDHLSDHSHVLHHIAADGDVVFLDHTETWTFKTGETVGHTFCTMHEMRDGQVSKWSDYWDVNKFVSQFPASFLEIMAKGSADDFTDG